MLELWNYEVGWDVWLLVAHELNTKVVKETIFKTLLTECCFQFQVPVLKILNLQNLRYFDVGSWSNIGDLIDGEQAVAIEFF